MRKSLLVLFLTAMIAATGCNKSGNTSADQERTDAQVASDVQSKINDDGALPNKQITINANNGTVTLSGSVGSDAERSLAGNDAASVNGVKTVVNNLTVGNTPAASPAPTAAPSSQPRRRSTKTYNAGNQPDTTNTMGNMNNTTAANVPPPAPRVVDVTVPSGSQLIVRVNDELSSETANAGDTFSGVLDSPVYVDDRVAIPSGADVRGRVVSAKAAAHFKGASELVLQINSVSYGGHQYQVATDRWARQGAARGKNTAVKAGGGAALGAIIGGIAGGGKGAAIGAGVGAAAGTGANAVTHGQQVVVKPESVMTFTLQQPVTVTPSSSNNSGRQRITPDSSNPQ